MRTVTVFASSSARADESYHKIATELGQALALKQFHVIYGAGNSGLMRALANGVIDNKGSLTGVIPIEMLPYADPRLSKDGPLQLIVEPDIEKRKVTLMQNTDVIIALPGGVGTFEEMYEAVTLGKIVILLNHDHYYDSLLAQHQNLGLLAAETVVEAMSLLGSSITQRDNAVSPLESQFKPKHYPITTYSEDSKSFLKTINATQDFIGFADTSGTFVTVMEKSQHLAFQESITLEPQNTIKHLLKFARSIIILPYESSISFAMLHKTLMYNQLGYNGLDMNGNQTHKRVLLFDPNNTDFFAPTIEQLKRACQEKLLVPKHCMGLTKTNNLNVIETAIDLPISGVENFCWWESAGDGEEQKSTYNQKFFDHMNLKTAAAIAPHIATVDENVERKDMFSKI